MAVLDDAQMRALIGFKPRTFRQARTHLAVLLILDTGLRLSEALNLRQADIDFDKLILKVFGKGQKERLVPFSLELRKRIYRYQQLKAKKAIRSDPLFAGFDDTRVVGEAKNLPTHPRNLAPPRWPNISAQNMRPVRMELRLPDPLRSG